VFESEKGVAEIEHDLSLARLSADWLLIPEGKLLPRRATFRRLS
jgi:hypothetical protein